MGSANLSIADWAPLYSCFTKDNVFVEPVYGQKGKPEKSENEQMLRPMMRSSSGRVLPLMSRMERISRFRQAHSSRGGRHQQQSQMSNANTNFTRSAASMSSEKIQFESPEAQADSAPGRPRTAPTKVRTMTKIRGSTAPAPKRVSHSTSAPLIGTAKKWKKRPTTAPSGRVRTRGF
jgi:hypothetical protein